MGSPFGGGRQCSCGLAVCRGADRRGIRSYAVTSGRLLRDRRRVVGGRRSSRSWGGNDSAVLCLVSQRRHSRNLLVIPTRVVIPALGDLSATAKAVRSRSVLRRRPSIPCPDLTSKNTCTTLYMSGHPRKCSDSVREPPKHSAVLPAEAGIHRGGKRSSHHDRTVTHWPHYFTITRKSDRMQQNTTHLEEPLQHTVALNPL